MEEEKDYAITTIDNPYNPFTQFLEWMGFDHEKGYNTLEWLARLAPTSPELTNSENDALIRKAYADMLSFNGLYKIIEKE